MGTQKIPRSFGTHDGTFHADEVTACALLLVFDSIDFDKIIRTRDLKKLAVCEYVCDVGGIYDPAQKMFDHHQVDYQGELSSAGMILEYLKEQGTIDQKTFDFYRKSLFMGIDDHDNGRDPQRVGYCSFSNLIANFTPITYEASESEQNHGFFEAVTFTRWHLERLLKRFRYMQSCKQQVAEEMNKNRPYLLFNHGLPWLESFFDLGGLQHPALFIIMPSGKHWKLRAIPPCYEERMKVRKPLPEEWAGLLDEELKRVSGISGAIFCHKGRFISVWETKEDALKALQFTLDRVGVCHDC